MKKMGMKKTARYFTYLAVFSFQNISFAKNYCKLSGLNLGHESSMTYVNPDSTMRKYVMNATNLMLLTPLEFIKRWIRYCTVSNSLTTILTSKPKVLQNDADLHKHSLFFHSAN